MIYRILSLAASLLIVVVFDTRGQDFKAVGAPSNPKVEVAWNRYYDYDGTRRMRLLKGVRTKAAGRVLLAQIELRVRAGKPGLDDGRVQPETETAAGDH